jgi:hypothetical protein
MEAKATAALLLANPLTAAYAPVALTQAAVILAQLPLIAASLALQLSQLNKYAKGRKGGRGEYALTGEFGPEIMWIPDGASIVPAHKSKKLMEGMKIADEYKIPFPKMPSFFSIDVDGLKGLRGYAYIDYDRLGRAVADNVPSPKIHFPEVQQLNVNMDEGGFTKFVSGKTGRTVILNARC